jgi:hypothetical protein
MSFVVNPEDFAAFVQEAAECDRKCAELRATRRRLVARAEKQRQLALLHHLDDLPDQGTLFDDDP